MTSKPPITDQPPEVWVCVPLEDGSGYLYYCSSVCPEPTEFKPGENVISEGEYKYTVSITPKENPNDQ